MHIKICANFSTFPSNSINILENPIFTKTSFPNAWKENKQSPYFQQSKFLKRNPPSFLMETAAALQAKEAALQKMRNGDFSGARELAVAAQSLSPGMEGFDQMITVCNVHCAANAGSGGDGKDWYKILDVPAEADEGAVRRQCGRMAVALHPDKNGLPGASEAFQLIVEAKTVLGDVERRRVYDSMCRAKAMADQWGFGFSRFQDNQETNGFARFRRVGLGDDASRVFEDGEVEIMDFGFSRFLNYEKIELSGKGLFHSGGPTWENGGQGRGRGRGRGRGSKLNKPSSIKEKGVASQDALLDGSDQKSGVGVKRRRGRPRGTGSKLNEPSSIKEDGLKRPRGTVSKLNKLAASQVENLDLGFSGFPYDGGAPNWDNGFSTLLNGGRGSKAAPVDATTKRPRGRPPGRGRGRGRSNNVEISSQEEGEIASRPKNNESHTTSAPEADKYGKIRPDSEILEYTDAEFNDFEQERSRECFETGQVWAVYDTLDAMPRFYAMINGILDDHKLEITWLEPLPEDEDEKRWLYRGLPASSGRFKQGYSEVIQDYAVFSHLVKWKRDAILRKVHAIRPQKGETWAVFKNWDTIRSQWLDTGMKFGEVEYEVVEIMSDYYGDFGVNVALLDRVEGFGCVFGRKEGNWEVIGAKNRLSLSHKIPSFSVCVGGVGSFFELDPASLPRPSSIIV